MGLYQPDGGFVLSERCIVNHVFAAQERGGEVHAREQVLEWRSQRGRRASRDQPRLVRGGALVITSGAWAGPQAPSLDGLLTPERQVMGWFQPRRPELFALGAIGEFCPVVIGEFEEGLYYSFPVFGIPGFKIGKFHHLGEATTADEPRPRLPARGRGGAAAGRGPLLPRGERADAVKLRACMFTNTPDEHFIIDAGSPGSPNVFVAGVLRPSRGACPTPVLRPGRRGRQLSYDSRT